MMKFSGVTDYLNQNPEKADILKIINALLEDSLFIGFTVYW